MRIHLLKDLETDLVYQIPENQLEEFKVPDDEVVYLFERLRIDGVSKPFLEKSIEVVAKEAIKTSR